MKYKEKRVIGNATLYLADCMDVMPYLEKVDAVVTDPPYGIDFGNFNRTNKLKNGKRVKANKYKNGDWDKEFDLAPIYPEIKRCSENIIIWGGNYFPCLWSESVKGFIFWNKNQPCKNFSAGELAWTSIDMPAKNIDYNYYGNIEGKGQATPKQHPTQKPLQVMKLCIDMFKDNPQTILDPFMGSGTTGVAAVEMDKEFIGIELDPDYFEIACERIDLAQRQGKLF